MNRRPTFRHVVGIALAAILILPASTLLAAGGKLRVAPHADGTVELTLERVPLSQAAGVLGLRIGAPVRLAVPDRGVTLALPRSTPLEALVRLAEIQKLELAREGRELVLRRPAPSRTVSLDVKDEEARTILRDVATQCGIRNLVLDRDVQGKGTFLFRDVPCDDAFRTIFASLGLAAEPEVSSLLHVQARR